MTTSRNQDFLRGTARSQSRILGVAGLATLAVIVAGMLATALLYPRVTAPKGIDIAVEVPGTGPGVGEGTKVLLHGRRIGEVVDLERTVSGSVTMQIVLDSAQIDGLTDNFEIDYRPENYFGTSAVNVIAGSGGTALASGMELRRSPEGDYTMSSMIEKGSLTIDGTLTDNMISSLDKSVHYLDGLTPWIETGVLVADRFAETQQDLPSSSVDKFNQILHATPGFADQAVDALMAIYDSKYNRRPDGSVGVDDAFMDETDAGLSIAGNKLFGQAGALLASHGDQLVPLTSIAVEASEVIPHLLASGIDPAATRDIVDRLDNAFVDSPDGPRLRLRLIVDAFPAITAPLGIENVEGQ